MAIRNIIKEGDEALTKKCRPVENFDRRLKMLIKDLTDTLRKADGVGLAAPQVGVLRRAVVILDDDEKTFIPLINPEIIKKEGKQEGHEGCLSIPGIFGKTIRPAVVTVKAFDENGKEFTLTRKGLRAVCLCHELDHLDGILFRTHVFEYIDTEKE